MTTERDLVELRAFFIYPENADMPHMVMTTGIHTTGDIEIQRAKVVLVIVTVEFAAAEVEIESPDAETPIFGNVDVVVRVHSIAPIVRVELEVDGRPAGVATEDPYRFRVNVGEKNASHRLEAIAVDAAGVRSSAVRETPA